MSGIRDTREWLLSTPAGAVFIAEHGGNFTAAFNAIVDLNTRERQQAYEANQSRAMSGLSPLSHDAAMASVMDRSGPYLQGSAESIRKSFHDPAFRMGVMTDESEKSPVHWEPRSLDFINAVRATRDQDPLGP